MLYAAHYYHNKTSPPGYNVWPDSYITQFIDVISQTKHCHDIDIYTYSRLLYGSMQIRAIHLITKSVDIACFHAGGVPNIETKIFACQQLTLSVMCTNNRMYAQFLLTPQTITNNLTLNQVTF